MNEAEAGAPFGIEAVIIMPRSFQELEGSGHIRLEEISWTVDRAINVRFGGKID